MIWIPEILILIYLTFNSYTDVKIKKISIIASVVFFSAGIVCEIFIMENSIISIIGGIVIGMVLLIIGKLTGQAIGLGDGLIFMVSGIYFGFMKNLALLLYALVICAVCSIILLVFKKSKMKDRIPFAPFVLASFLIMLFLEVL